MIINDIKTLSNEVISRSFLSNKQIILLGLGGSYAYGTNIEESDIDLRGIATHTPKEILTRSGFEQFNDTKSDTVIYSLEKMIRLLSDCNPKNIEIL